MAIKPIIEVPDDRLRVTYQTVDNISAVQTLIDDMLDTLYDTDNGIGLAAAQVGHSEAVLIIDISENRDQPLIMVNPQIIEHEGTVDSEEGCLSVPGVYAKVQRHQRVKVQALNRQGEIFTVEDDGYLAIVMQHEIDHLHGKIFIDYLSPLKRKMAMKKIKKFQRAKATVA
ncbi:MULTISPECIES: peptide deformylase [Vibrio oreintalis group]|uniref:Peptide deformylase n=1 Tax=Vibrio europaeus TaxID=300876 RepID=A0A178J3Q1_9VIBR|nr:MULTISPECIES: peptide deformylase [Vibrio oreintalis group]MCG9583490.1 peptide deformylase [Vibrio tubiashii]MCG9617067.1 peptide deformylase [Vibrio tubiashii]MCG9686475.1 peptide deformylase [Vibrio tubiashii]MDC5706703.1 peptide deformylase [Vibrio europaeus]MDC5711763.1 peptide deformylase [Vibrio europaeus]